MKKKKQNITDIFVRGRKLTLGIKLVGTFAFTYYLLYFVLLTVFGIYYRSVYNPAYSGETLFQTMLMSAILWFIVGMLVVSLILLFRRRRYGKFLFMIFTVILGSIYPSTSKLRLKTSFILRISLRPIFLEGTFLTKTTSKGAFSRFKR